MLRTLSAVALTLGLSGCAVAQAEPTAAFPGPRLIELLPSAGIVGDGATVASLMVLALAADGTPIPGLAASKVTVNTGALGPVRELGAGLYAIDYTPPKVDAAVNAQLVLKGKVGKENVTGTWEFPVVPSRTHGYSVTANPPRLTLGVDKTATLTLRFANGTRLLHGPGELVVRSSVGTVENLIDLGGGQVSALFRVPAQTHPQVALVTFADKHDPSRAIASVAIPMASRTEVPVVAAPKAQVLLKIGDQQFGPVPTDSKGRAKVPVLLQPGATLAEQISVDATGQSTSASVDLKQPETPRIALFPTAPGLPADGRRSVDVSATVVTNDGRPETSAAVLFTASSGSFGPTRSVGNGVYSAAYTPAPAAGPVVVKISAALAGLPAQVSTGELKLVGQPVATVELVATPATLAKGATALEVKAKLSGPDGQPVPGRIVDLVANGAKLAAPVKDGGKGEYTASFTTGTRGPVEVQATASTPAAGNLLWRVLVIPARARLPNDGLSSTRVTIATVDEFGYPVPNVPVDLVVTRGDGSLPATATTNAAGYAQVYYTAGRATDLVTFRATAGVEEGRACLFQAPEELALPQLPFVGVREEGRLVEEWRHTAAELTVPRAE